MLCLYAVPFRYVLKGAELLTCDAGAIKAAFEWFANQAGIGIPEWVPLPGTAQYLAAVERLDQVIYDIIRTRRQELEAGSRQPQVRLCEAEVCLLGKSSGGMKFCFWTGFHGECGTWQLYSACMRSSVTSSEYVDRSLKLVYGSPR